MSERIIVQRTKPVIIELHHPTDPRYLLVSKLPERVTVEDLGNRTYGKPLLVAPEAPVVVYDQPGGPGTDWIRPADAAGQLARAIEAEMVASLKDNVIGDPPTASTVDTLADHFHRRGVPVTRGRIEGDTIVYDIDTPKGSG